MSAEPALKRILVIGPTPPPYHGVAHATELLLQSDLRRTYELVHLDTADRRGIGNIGRFDLRNLMVALRDGVRFLTLLVKRPPDGIYLTLSQNRLAFLRDCLFLLPAIALRLPVVAHLHGGRMGAFLEQTDALTRGLLRWVLRHLSRVVVLGESLRPMIAGLVPAAQIDVVPNGILDPGRSSRRESGPVRVLYLASLMESKGFRDLLDAARTFKGRTDVEFVLAGELENPRDAPGLSALEQELNGLIRYVGVVVGAAKTELLRSADIFVFPTYYEYEGHPYVLLEAMAAGLAIVTTDHAAIAETVRSGREAVFVHKRSPRQLATVIDALVADPARRSLLGSGARQRYLECYTYTRWTNRMATVFDHAFALESEAVLAPAAQPVGVEETA